MAARKRELIEPHKGDKRYVRRNKKGEFKEVDDVGRSLAVDRRRKAKAVVKAGQGDKGDRAPNEEKGQGEAEGQAEGQGEAEGKGQNQGQAHVVRRLREPDKEKPRTLGDRGLVAAGGRLRQPTLKPRGVGFVACERRAREECSTASQE